MKKRMRKMRMTRRTRMRRRMSSDKLKELGIFYVILIKIIHVIMTSPNCTFYKFFNVKQIILIFYFLI